MFICVSNVVLPILLALGDRFYSVTHLLYCDAVQKSRCWAVHAFADILEVI